MRWNTALSTVPVYPQQKALEILARSEGTGDRRSALAALRELKGTVELTAKHSPGQMAGQGAQSSQTAQYRPYKDVPFEDLVALEGAYTRTRG